MSQFLISTSYTLVFISQLGVVDLEPGEDARPVPFYHAACAILYQFQHAKLLL
jgi:hypothetical protein